MKQAFQRKVWWPLKLWQFDEHGVGSEGKAMVLVTVLDKAAIAAHQATAIEAVRLSIAAQQLRNLPTAGIEPGLLAARKTELDDLDIQIELKNEQGLKVVRENVHDWRNVEAVIAGENQVVPFSADMLTDLLRFNDFQRALGTTLGEAANGARTKN